MLASEITAMNAYRHSDNYAIDTADLLTCYGCEHNEEEANAIASYLASYHGRMVIVRHVRQDLVRKALEFCGEPVRVKNREMILKDMGVWK